jgi:D-cysteine desulfhydrase
VATLLHAPRVGLHPRFVLFPQPLSRAAAENFRVIVSRGEDLTVLRHWSSLPFALWSLGRRADAARRFVMVPGGATPMGALGYVSAAFELSLQVRAGVVPAPSQVIVGVGSTCTSAGLLLGFFLAARLGIGFSRRPPRLTSVRVTPWPVTSRYRIVDLAVRASRLLSQLARDASLIVDRAQLNPLLELDGRYLGRGYGRETDSGRNAIDAFRRNGGPELDTTYSGKAAAAVLARLRSDRDGPLVFWSTKSTAPLPDTLPSAAAPARAVQWLGRYSRPENPSSLR